MKKVVILTVGGIGLATAVGLAGLPHLSATLATLTVFCAFWVLAVWSFGVVWALPERIADYVEAAAKVSVGGKREGRE